MKVVLQRASHAHVTSGGRELGAIKKGLVVLLGVAEDDEDPDLTWMLEKVLELRIFGDTEGKLNLSVMDIHGGLLIISQFTLLADVQKGRRPSFIHAAASEKGRAYYEKFIQMAKERGMAVSTGEFGADMQVELVNDGPVTIILDSEQPS